MNIPEAKQYILNFGQMGFGVLQMIAGGAEEIILNINHLKHLYRGSTTAEKLVQDVRCSCGTVCLVRVENAVIKKIKNINDIIK